MDMLTDMFERNSKLTKFLRENAPRGDMPEDILQTIEQTPEVVAAIQEVRTLRNTLAMYAETAEYNDETKFKWWGRGAWEQQKPKSLEELIDLLHFFFIAVEDLGYGPNDIYKEYCRKNEVNWQRFKEKLGWKVPQR